MSWVTVTWTMVAGLCMGLAVLYFLVWIKDRTARVNIVFSIWTASFAISALWDLTQLQAQTPGEYAEALGHTSLPLAVMAISFFVFVRLYLEAGRKWLMWSCIGLLLFELLAKFVLLPTLPFSKITALRHTRLWGQTLAMPVGPMSSWAVITAMLLLLIPVFVVDASIQAWRRHRKRQVRMVALAVSATSVSTISIVILSAVARPDSPIILTLTMPGLIMVLVMAYGLSRDLINARQLAADFQASQERIRLAASAADLDLWEYDVATQEIWATEESRNRVSYNGSAVILFERFLRSVHPDDREATSEAGQRALAEGGELDIEYRIVTPDGETRWLATRGSVECDDRGRPLRIRGVSMDITERKRTEESLRMSEERLKEAQHLAHLGNWELDLRTDTLIWSDEIYRIFEIDPEGFGASYEAFLDAVYPDDRDAVNKAYTESIKTGQRYEITHRILMPDGRIKHVREKCKTFYDDGGKPIRSVGTVQDITAQREAENESTRLANELTHINRVMTLNELAASLAHEISQPLGAILRNAEAGELLLIQSPPNYEELRAIFADIREDDRRATAVIDHMRSLMKRRDLQFEQVSVAELLDGVAALAQAALQAFGVKIDIEVPPDLPLIRCDRVHLQQVLLNLVTNAAHAMEEVPNERRKLHLLARRADDQAVEVTVRDHGTGIPGKIMSDLFKPFVSTKSEGIGMGLAISSSIVAAHGGRIWAENNPDGGATFRFTLKVAEKARGEENSRA